MGTSWISRKEGILERGGGGRWSRQGGYGPPYQLYINKWKSVASTLIYEPFSQVLKLEINQHPENDLWNRSHEVTTSSWPFSWALIFYWFTSNGSKTWLIVCVSWKWWHTKLLPLKNSSLMSSTKKICFKFIILILHLSILKNTILMSYSVNILQIRKILCMYVKQYLFCFMVKASVNSLTADDNIKHKSK